ncbi:M48 family metallopeptidase [Lentzea indica]|uniref:M48 family metallopeptidase n=1 Tax=Lentzea indica TaxID=2604800 RepID=UPI0035E44D55
MGISPRAYEHPADRGALAVLRAVPAVAPILKAVAAAFSERGERLLQVASSVRVGPKQYPQLDRIRNEVAATFDLDTVPELYVQRHPVEAAWTSGIDTPFIVLTTGLVDLLDNESLRFVIGHEMGHVMSGHALYNTLLRRLIGIQQSFAWVPAGALAMRAVIAALREWQRKTELSCDRAGLLAARTRRPRCGRTSRSRATSAARSTSPSSSPRRRSTRRSRTSATASSSSCTPRSARTRWSWCGQPSCSAGRRARSTARS